MANTSVNFSFKVPDEILQDLLVRYLISEGCITYELSKKVFSMERVGSATMVHFSVDSKPE